MGRQMDKWQGWEVDFPNFPLFEQWYCDWLISEKKTHGAEYPTKDIPETPQLKNDMNTPEAPRSLIRCLGEARTRDSVVIPTELRDILKTGLWTLHRIFRVWDICWLRVWSEVVFRNTFYISLEGSRDHACPIWYVWNSPEGTTVWVTLRKVCTHMSVGSKYLPKDLLHQEETFLLLNIQALGGSPALSRLLSQVYPTCSHWRQNVYQKIIPTLMISANNVSRMVSHAIPSLDSVWPQKLLLFHTVISDLEINT